MIKPEDKMFKPIQDRIITNIKNLFEQEEVYSKPVRASDFEYNSNGDRNKTLSTQKYLMKLNHT